jgi:hypothetical protein
VITFCLKDSHLQHFHRFLVNYKFNPQIVIVLHKTDDKKEDHPEVIREVCETAGAVGIPPEFCFAKSMFDGSLLNSATLKRSVDPPAVLFQSAHLR